MVADILATLLLTSFGANGEFVFSFQAQIILREYESLILDNFLPKKYECL